MTKTRTSQTVLSIFAALMALMLMAAPAFASHKDSHDPSAAASAPSDKGDRDGDADSDPGTSYTEDNDTNDGGTKNNVADEGDNAHPSGKDRSVENGKSGTQGKSESDPDDDGRGPDRSNGGPDKANGSGGVDKADQDGNNGCGNDDDFEDDNEGWCGKRPEKDDEVKGNDEHKPCDKDATMPGTQPCDKDEHKPCDKDATMPGTQPCDDDEVEGDDDKVKGKITICHATGSMTNPYVVITISTNGLNGHGDHEGDIIPAPAHGCPAPANVPDEVLPDTETPDVDEDGSSPEVDEDEVLGEVISKEDTVAPAAEQRGPRVLGAALPFTGASILSFLAASFALIAGGFAFTRKSRS